MGFVVSLSPTLLTTIYFGFTKRAAYDFYYATFKGQKRHTYWGAGGATFWRRSQQSLLSVCL